MVELRKRKSATTANPPEAKKPETKKSKREPEEPEEPEVKDVDDSSPKIPDVGNIIDLETFGGAVETNDGTPTSLKKLLEESKSGVVFFTYPKASTPGCEYPHFDLRSKLVDGELASLDSIAHSHSSQAPSKLAYSVIIIPT